MDKLLIKASYLVLQVRVAEGRDEDPGDAGVPVPGRRVQRGVAVLQRTTKQRGAIKQISWVVCRLDVGFVRSLPHSTKILDTVDSNIIECEVVFRYFL